MATMRMVPNISAWGRVDDPVWYPAFEPSCASFPQALSRQCLNRTETLCPRSLPSVALTPWLLVPILLFHIHPPSHGSDLHHSLMVLPAMFDSLPLPCVCGRSWDAVTRIPPQSDGRHPQCKFLGPREFSAPFPNIRQLLLLPFLRSRKLLPVS